MSSYMSKQPKVSSAETSETIQNLEDRGDSIQSGTMSVEELQQAALSSNNQLITALVELNQCKSTVKALSAHPETDLLLYISLLERKLGYYGIALPENPMLRK